MGNVHPGLNSLKLGHAEIHTQKCAWKGPFQRGCEEVTGRCVFNTQPLQAGSLEVQGHSACRCTNTVY